tara:strand:+ start:561 stop:1247 length:687 start_codon:yes stop_codon:yes gene_type:complete
MHCYLLSLVLGLSVALSSAESDKIRVVLAGDSTVTDSEGWGAAFAERLTSEAKCINLAVGGRSSKSFRDEGHWKKVLKAKPDFVLIQFGHNDMPGKGPKRETDPETTFRENMTRYVREARAAGAQPILITSLTRRIWVDGRIQGELKPWADATRKVAEEEKIPLIDLFARSVELHEKLGLEASAEFNPPGKNGKIDRTHLFGTGADIIANLIVEELRGAVPELAKFLE